jgi:hypothetical protein
MWLVAENVTCLAEKYGLLGNMACLFSRRYSALAG